MALAGFLTLWLLPVPGAAQATPYVPALDPAYRDLEVLVSAGLVRGIIPGQRPHSRMTFARAAGEARAQLDAGESVPKPRLAEALRRLEAGFAAELALLCEGGAEACPPAASRPALREIVADLTAASSPARPIPDRELVPDPRFPGAELDADVNPLLQRNQGRALADGWTLGTEARAELALGSRFAVQLHPRVQLSDGGDGAAVDASLVRGYARGLFGNLSVDVGRNQVPQGAAREYGVAMSNNIRGMDMVRLSMERPARLPWIFRHLGPVALTTYVGDLGRDRDTPGSKLIVIEGALRPHRNLQLGGSLMNQQFGEGIPSASLGQRIRDILGFLPRRPFYNFDSVGQISDKALSLDARLNVPSRGLELYAEVLTTDDHDLLAGWREALWNDAAWVWGGGLVGLGPEGRLDARIEASRAGVRPYTHHQFTSGMTLDRRVMGTPLGPLAAGVTGTLEWNGAHQTVGMAWAWERYSGDQYAKPGPDPEDQQLVRVADNPDEVRLRTALDWTRQSALGGLRTTVRLGYEHVTRFDFTDRNRSNFLAQASVGYVW